MSLRITSAVVAHRARAAHAYTLAAQLDASITMDDGSIGAGHNHLRAWRTIAQQTTADWLLVLEDDAILCRDFGHLLDAALDAAPSPVVSLYLGSGYPVQWRTRAAAAATAHNGWATLPAMLHAVAIAIRADHAHHMLDHLDLDRPIDEAIGAWARDCRLPIGYTVPCLVDHRDDCTLIAHPDGFARSNPRRALRFADTES